MFDGSVTSRRSIPRASMAARVLASRSAYSARPKFSATSGIVVVQDGRRQVRRPHLLARDQAVVQAHVDVAAGDHDRGRAARAHLPGQERPDADRAAALDDLLLAPVGVPDRGRDLGLLEQHDLVDELADYAEGPAVVEADPAAQRIRERGQLLDRDRAAGPLTRVHRGPA